MRSHIERAGKDNSKKLPDYVAMYEIPGHGNLTSHDFERYTRDKKQDELIKKHAEIDEQKKRERGKIDSLSEIEIASLIEQGLENKDVEVRRNAAEGIKKAPEVQVAEFIRIGIKDPDWIVRRNSLLAIESALTKDREALIREGLEQSDIRVQKAAVQMVDSIGGRDEDILPLKKLVSEKMKQALESVIEEKKLEALSFITQIPKEEQFTLLAQCFHDPNIKIKKKVLGMMRCLSDDEQREVLIQWGLAHDNPEIRKEATANIHLAPKNHRSKLIQQALQDIQPEVQKAGVSMIRDAGAQLFPLLENHFEKLSPEAKREVFRVMPFLVVSKRAGLEQKIFECMKKDLVSNDENTRKVAIEMLKWIPEQEKDAMFDNLLKQGYGEDLIRPPLYFGKGLNEKSFSRAEFEKTGTETTLLGGSLKEKIIVRHVPASAFLSWQRLYEDYDMWRENGFDYVPIEPIQSYQFNKQSGLVDVYSGVLDINLETWNRETSRFRNELAQEYKKLEMILKKNNIDHGHLAPKNVCLRFFRDEQGRIDFNKIPRLYVIDFDEAISLPETI